MADNNKWWLDWTPPLLVAVSVGVSIWMIVVSADRKLTTLELTLFQVLTLGVGLGASFAFGRRSATASAMEMVRPHARSAFRRVVFIAGGLRRIAIAIEERRSKLDHLAAAHNGSIPEAHAMAALDILEAQVVGQIVTASDAMEDWRDLVPEEVEEIENRAREAREHE
jgi:hypothetical protein